MKHHHTLDPKVAELVGISAALIIWNLSYLQSQRESQGGGEFYHDSKWWVRHSYESLAEWHSYLSVQQVRRIMKKLEDDGHVSKAHLGRNPWDRTAYWHVSSVFMHVSESTDGSVGIDRSEVSESTHVQHKNNNKHSVCAFDEFWTLYPKKQNKKNSRLKFQKLKPEDQQKSIAYLTKKPFKDTETRFVPCATKFINGARWEDELPNESKSSIGAFL